MYKDRRQHRTGLSEQTGVFDVLASQSRRITRIQ
jgi:hypothetical protein